MPLATQAFCGLARTRSIVSTATSPTPNASHATISGHAQSRLNVPERPGVLGNRDLMHMT